MYQLHILATWLHIISAIYWLGAIFFILTALGPVLRKQPSIVVPPIMTGVHRRVRRNVLVAIIVFVITGVFNMYYRGLFDPEVLFRSTYGRIFLFKMLPVTVMFTLYFSAPYLMKRFSSNDEKDECKESVACCEMEEGHKPGNKVFAVLHVVALACGLLAVFLGVLLRG
ncbi:MAG: CopD family protein [Deltaproteobacteria bacterium]|nr:CopD family protein [Deltaproteobacteria bacterium]